jgi:hypothetical protein
MKPLLVILAAVLAGYFGWKKYKEFKEPTPEQKAAAFFAQSSFSAPELADMCDKFPKIAEATLRDRKIQVTGTVKRVLVKGVSSQDLAIEIEGSAKRRVSLSSDVNRVARINSNAPEGRFKFEKHGRDIIVLNATPTPTTGTEGDREVAAPQKSMRAFMRELDQTSLEAVFKHLTKSAVVLEWRQPGHL